MHQAEVQLNDTKRGHHIQMLHPKSGAWNKKGGGVQVQIKNFLKLITVIQGRGLLGFCFKQANYKKYH